MDYNLLSLVNRVLMMNKQPTVDSAVSGVSIGDDAYKVRLCVEDAIFDISKSLRIKSNVITFNITTVAGQKFYRIPKSVDFPIISLVDTSNNLKLRYMQSYEYDEYIQNSISSGNSGNPEAYYFDSYTAIESDLASSGEQLDVYGWSFGAAQQGIVVITGYLNTDYYQQIRVECDQPTVTISYIFNHISSINVEQFVTNVSNIDIKSNTDNRLIARLYTFEPFLQLAKIGLYPTPKSAITLTGRGYAKQKTMLFDHEVPANMGYNFIDAITLGAYAKYLRYQPGVAIESVNNAFNAYYEELRKLIAMYFREPDAKLRIRSASEIPSINYFRPLDRWSK